jgi:hypothetical protein
MRPTSLVAAALLTAGCATDPSNEREFQQELCSIPRSQGWKELGDVPQEAPMLLSLSGVIDQLGAHIDGEPQDLWFRAPNGDLRICRFVSTGADQCTIQYKSIGFSKAASGWSHGDVRTKGCFTLEPRK